LDFVLRVFDVLAGFAAEGERLAGRRGRGEGHGGRDGRGGGEEGETNEDRFMHSTRMGAP